MLTLFVCLICGYIVESRQAAIRELDTLRPSRMEILIQVYGFLQHMSAVWHCHDDNVRGKLSIAGAWLIVTGRPSELQ